MRVGISELAAGGAAFGTSGVRGKVQALTDRVCMGYTLAFLQHLAPAVAGGAPAVVLGHDLRPSSPRMAAACATAAASLGWRAVFLGAIPTPAVAHFALQAGLPAIVITGSHIPFDRNGIKFYTPAGEILKADEAAISAATVELDEALFAGDTLETPAPLPDVERAGEQRYVERYLRFFPKGMLRGRRVGIYEHSSVARDLLERTLAALGADIVPLGRTDTFVPVDTEAVSDADQEQARAWARDHRLDALVSTDGDADRPLVADEHGTFLRGDIVGMLCAGYLGADTVVTPVSSNTAVERWGRFRQVVRTRIGSPYVIEAMERAAREGSSAPGAGPVVGYEANGGFLLGTGVERRGTPSPAGAVNPASPGGPTSPASPGGPTSPASPQHPLILSPLPTRDALLPMLAVLALAAERGGPVSAVTEGLPARFTASDRLQDFDAATARALLARLSSDAAVLGAFFAPLGRVAEVSTVDGLRVTLDGEEIVHLRPSGNAPELRCYAEADTPERARTLAAWGLGAADAARK